jgi:hypothetical protein
MLPGLSWLIYTVFNAHKIQPHVPCSKTPESDPCFWLAFCMSSDCLGNVPLLPVPVTLQHKNLLNVTMHICLDSCVSGPSKGT